MLVRRDLKFTEHFLLNRCYIDFFIPLARLQRGSKNPGGRFPVGRVAGTT